MAFTAVHYPMDKDQTQFSYWPDNEELAVAGDNFFDQFVTFDSNDPTALSGDLLEDPPSPSILLESLDQRLSDSCSNDQGSQPDQTQAESAASSFSSAGDFLTLPCEAPTTTVSSPSGFTTLAADPVLGGGSISDSELLRLEGISLKSPKRDITAPASPILINPASSSPRKHNRFVDSVYATIRRATHRSKPNKQPSQQAVHAMDLFQTNLGPTHAFHNTGLDDYTKDGRELMPEPIDNSGLPLSPPLTGKIPNDHHSNGMSFVHGQLDDPFCDGLPVSSAANNHSLSSHALNTPMDTPLMDGEAFYQHALAAVDMGNAAYSHPPTQQRQQQPKQRSTSSSAEWPMEGLLTDDANPWATSSSSYVPDSNPSPGWWETGDLVSDSHHLAGSRSHGSLNLAQHPTTTHHRHNTDNNASAASNNTDLPYEYSHSSAADLSGLMIHMPQPRAPQAAVLTANLPDTLSAYTATATAAASPSRHPLPPPSSSHHGRRPRPRAPSSGARHYHHQGSLTSPRKQQQLHHAGSRGYLREASASPTPRARHVSSPAVQKRRSWRTASSSSSSGGGGGYEFGGSFPGSEGMTVTVSSSSSSSSPRRGGGGEIGFVNFTPSDKNVLMTGVAPSGSSKTKARREKEAMEKRRRISEAAMKAVRAAGGNVDKLMEEGFFDRH
ncbi:hypothetical protein F4780DRAFT_797828 [Xylariomycetidae sp. FL0641]|nr:hypothetical protein F4780DRAFT_797828 [Xylariomycetidae sp. FL0641]